MSFGADEEILQDFLVEAGEIIELLSEQLVELESQPDDMELLNAIFRGFHTVKGGAGFLQLTELVECCHIAENVFDILRKGERRVTPDLMDVVLQALDNVTSMFHQVRERRPLTPAPADLLEALAVLARPEDPDEAVQPDNAAPDSAADADDADAEFEQMLQAAGQNEQQAAGQASAADSDLISEDEFEALLDELQGKQQPAATTAEKPASDEITEEEFEALLDELHGQGKAAAAADSDSKVPSDTSSAAPAGDEITDDEFEQLLDDLHGKGQFKPPETPAQPAAARQETPAPAAKKTVSGKKLAPPRAARNTPASTIEDTTVRVDTARLDEIMNMVGELVLVRNRLVRLGLDSGDEDMGKAVANLDVVTGDLQTSVMKTRKIGRASCRERV